MATGEALLALLLPSSRHGYDLKRAHDDWFAGFRLLAFGQVYSTLSRLQRDGLIQVAHTETGEGPERVVYELTPAGRQRALAWLSDPVDPGAGQSDELIRKIIAAHRLNADPDGLMVRQRTAHLRSIRALEPAVASAGPGGAPATGSGLSLSLLADHARLHLDADLRWLEIAADRIRLARRAPGDWSSISAITPQPSAYDEPEHDQSEHDPSEHDPSEFDHTESDHTESDHTESDHTESDHTASDHTAFDQAESDQGARP